MVAAVRTALLLDQQHVIMLEPEVANVPRPSLPYVGLKIETAATRYGRDTQDVSQTGVDGLGNPVYTATTAGPREVSVVFNSYAATHEQAYGLMTTWEAFLDTVLIEGQLRAAGIAVWRVGNVEDSSALLNTAYEGRASVRCTFGVQSRIAMVTTGIIESITAAGQVATEQSTAEVVVTATGD